ncbi:MAG: hypothetical protein IKF45_00455 [Lachnospiraceae bacterium]|nr:hypothetical protein [Lachnospiraceae bacterium]
MRKLINLTMFVVDIVLLVIIVRAYAATKTEAQTTSFPETQEYETEVAQETGDLTTVGATPAYDSESTPSYNSENTASEEQAYDSDQTSAEETGYAEQTEYAEEAEGSSYDSESTPANETPVQAQADFNTMEPPTLTDFEWVNNEIFRGQAPSGVQRLGFDETLGSWKAYLVDLSSDGTTMKAERFLNVTVSGTPENAQLTFDFHYLYVSSAGEGYDESGQQGVFNGSMTGEGAIDTLGAGRIVITDFWTDGGHQYAIGTMTWPDAVRSTLMMVRP